MIGKGSKIRYKGGPILNVLKIEGDQVTARQIHGNYHDTRYARQYDLSGCRLYDKTAEKAAALIGAEPCQICGRPIHVASGLIAHHGYERPHNKGFQTPSCWGARHPSFNHSRDQLGLYIEMMERQIIDLKQARAALDVPGVLVPGPEVYAKDPVTGEKIRSKNGYDYKMVPMMIGPDFVPKYSYNRKYPDYLGIAVANADNRVKWAIEHRDEQQKRYNGWKLIETDRTKK